MGDKSYPTFVDLLQDRATHQPSQQGYTFLLDGEANEASLSYFMLDCQARRIAAALQELAAPGDRALLLYPPGLEYIAAFFGCLYAGIIAIPAYPPTPTRIHRSLSRLHAIVQDAQPALALTTAMIKPLGEAAFVQDSTGSPLRWLATDTLAEGLEETWSRPQLNPDTVAFLQYTSGSTSTPKGVIVTHANLLHNSALIHQCFGHSEESRGVIWLPPYHDMGLIGGVLQPLYGGFPVTLLFPLDFLQRPIRWLQAISRYRATTSGGPNFAYDLCVRKIPPEQRAALDLSCWDLAFNGAEPIQPATLQRFAEAFAVSRFRPTAFYPCYGLAEATLIVSGGRKGQTPTVRTFDNAGLADHQIIERASDTPGSRGLLGCGAALPGQQILIVHPETRTLCPPNQVGEIWAAGPSVAQGYWGQAAETAAAFRARLHEGGPETYLRTGDLGFLHEGELFITGRLKDVIIIRGRNYYPHDIERTAERAHAGLRPGCGAAFMAPGEDTEHLVIVHEVDRTYRKADVTPIVQAIRQAVVEEHGLQPNEIVLLRHGSIPKTSSGKIQRYACRDGLRLGQLDVITQVAFTPDSDVTEAPALSREAILAAPADLRLALIEQDLLHRLASLVGQAPEALNPQQRLSDLGLDSMMGIEAQHALEANFGVALSLTVFLDHTTIRQLAEQILMALASALMPSKPPTTPTPAAPREALSYGQRALWFLQQLAPSNAAYNIARAARICADLDALALQRALQSLANRHRMLRTTFPNEHGIPRRRTYEHSTIVLRQEHAAGLSDAALYECLSEEAHRPFNLEQDALVRVYLFTRSPQEHVLLLVAHHIVIDFWSLTLLIQDLAALYAQEQTGTAAVLEPQQVQYDDYVGWQHELLAGQEGARLWAYWRQQLAGELPVLDVPADYPRPPVQTYHGAEQFRTLSAQLTSALKELSRTHGATLYMTLLSAWQVWLSRLTGQTDMLVGSLTTGRQSVDVARVIGYFVNPIVLRGNLRENPPFVVFLEQMRQTILAAFAHQQFPFALLAERLQPDRRPSHPPLVQVLFTMQQVPFGNNLALAPFSLNQPGGKLDLGSLSSQSLPIAQHMAQFDLALAVAETVDGLGMTLQYNRDLFAPVTIARFLDQFQTLLEGIVSNPHQLVADLPLLDARERNKLLVGWNATEVTLPRGTRLHDLIEAQAAQTPDAIAVVFEDHSLSYAALNGRANRLARYLRSRGIEPDTLVGLCVDRSLAMVVGLLGILKAGGAYVPLDPNHPTSRLEYIVQDAQLQVLLTQTWLRSRLPLDGMNVIELDRDWPESWEEVESRTQNSGATADNLAYAIYTSGSTGKPKGTLIPHAAVVNFLQAMRRAPGIHARDSLLAVTTLSFDIAALEIFLPLVVGARVILLSREATVDGARLAALLDATGTTIMQATPATWRLLLEAGWVGKPNLTILCGGEALPLELATQLLPRSAALWNMYGPTETTIWSAVMGIPPGQQVVTIGGPIANTQIYILNARMQPVPIGVTGELYIAGAGVARGYLNRPDLTAERFVPNPFTRIEDRGLKIEDSNLAAQEKLSSILYPLSSTRLYRTGDLARYRLDGQIEYLGRIDQQVKIRGFRIELGEIEAVLAQHPDVRLAVVVAREGRRDERRLVAYIVPGDWRLEIGDSSGDNLQSPISNLPHELRSFLRDKLPDYMLPATFVIVRELPMTPNGKIDRRALPDPETHTSSAQKSMPRSQLEQTLAAIWRAVLQSDHVGIDDNFFDLGGHSLLVAQVHSRLHEQLGVELSMVDLFKHPTISALAAHLQQAAHVPPQHTQPARDRQPDVEDAAIAIIGMAGRFPGASDIETFWGNLRNGVESISFFTDQELIAAGIDAELLNQPNYVKARATLQGVELFDAAFFGIHPREAESMDPQHRLFLECAWHALEHAGYDSARYQGRIGLYAGVGMNTYLLHVDRDQLASVGAYQAFIGNDKDFVPTRVSYKLNLRGPSVNVQTACSSSLVALHLACQSLLTGACDMAMAGAVSISVPQTAGYIQEAGGILSPDGHCRAFDARAQGTVFGSGVGIVVIKRLRDALSDGDTIHAVIKGSAINNDGSAKIGYTAPSVEGQAAVIAEALAAAQVPPETIQYVEAHGTGTPLGDPIEIAALTQIYGARAGGHCAIGSVKTNIGHLDTAAGIAGLIKAVQALTHRQIPPSLHFEQPNPQLDLANSPFYVNTTLPVWPQSAAPRRAAVSSFGIGGTNAHVILEEAPVLPPTSTPQPWNVLILSAKTSTALEASVANVAAHLRRFPDLCMDDVAYTLQVGRHALSHRRALVYRERADALEALEGGDPARMLSAVVDSPTRAPIFMFPGQGAQYERMGWDLYQHEAVFREAVDHCANVLRPHLGLDIRELIYPDDRPPTTDHPRPTIAEGERGRGGEGENGHSPISTLQSLLNQTQYAQPALFVIEYALSQLWMARGVRPAAMIGHSIGEYIAACLAGVMALEDALELVAVRGRLMQQLPGGAMLSVLLPEAEVLRALETAQQAEGQPLELAAVNSATHHVVAGTHEAIRALERQLVEQGVVCRAVQTSHAFHTQSMEPILAPFFEHVRQIKLSAPQIPYISNVSGDWITPDQATDPHYWTQQIRQPVRFGQGVQRLLASAADMLLEVGPGNTLSTFARQQAAGRTIASMRHPKEQLSDVASMLNAASRLWLAGVELDWAAWYEHQQRRRIPLPVYPFEGQRYWIDPAPLGARRTDPVKQKQQRAEIANWFSIPVWKSSILPALAAPESRQPTTWLVLTDDHGPAKRLVERLKEEYQRVVLVRPAAAFRQIDSERYELCLQRQEDYETLFARLHAQDLLPQQIVHAWSLTADDETAAQQPFLDRGFASLLYLAQAIGNQKLTTSITLSIVSNNMCEVIGGDLHHPEKATIVGPYLVIPREYPHLSCRLIDIDLPPADSRPEQQLVDQLLRELQTQQVQHMVAYRGGRRWVQAFESLRLDRADAPVGLLRPQGTYLITGGLGGIGLEIAAYLARTVQAKLVLTGRSVPPDRTLWDEWLATHDQQDLRSRQIRQVRDLEAHGAEVLLCQADVTDETAMREVVERSTMRFGPINGVIHAAGLAGGGMIQFRALPDASAVLAPKLQGTLVLAKLFASAHLDFLILQSSLNTVVGRFGQADYTAANAFLDAFAQFYSRTTGTLTIAINWDAWGQVGMAARFRNQGEAQELERSAEAESTAPDGARGEHDSIEPQEGVEAFARILSARIGPQVIVSVHDIESVRERTDSFVRERILEATEAQTQPKQLHARPNLNTPYVAPGTEIEKTIAEVWQDVLGINRIGIHDNFFELGGSSLTGIQIIAQLEQTLNIHIPPVAVFESTSIHMLAQTLDPASSEKPAYQKRQERGEKRRNSMLQHRKPRS